MNNLEFLCITDPCFVIVINFAVQSAHLCQVERCVLYRMQSSLRPAQHPSNLSDIYYNCRPQKNPSCQFHPSTKPSFPSTPRDILLVGESLSLSQATLPRPQMIPTPASMVTRLPGVSPCIMETLTIDQLLITLISPL